MNLHIKVPVVETLLSVICEVAFHSNPHWCERISITPVKQNGKTFVDSLMLQSKSSNREIELAHEDIVNAIQQILEGTKKVDVESMRRIYKSIVDGDSSQLNLHDCDQIIQVAAFNEVIYD